MIITGTVNRITEKIVSAERLTLKGFEDGEIETEPSLTDRLLGAIKYSFSESGFAIEGYSIKIRTLGDRGKNAPEHEFGADFLCVLDIQIPDYSLSKGFLAQAKLAGKEEIAILEKGQHPEIQICFPKGKIQKSRLRNQCEQMLNISPDSFVFVYSNRGIYVVSATTVVSINDDGSPKGVYSKSLEFFYKDFLMSFIGDRRLNAYDDQTLRRLQETTFSNSAMLIEMRKIKNSPSRFSLVEI